MTTVVASFKTALLAAIRAQLPGVQVMAVDPAKNRALREAVWIDGIDSVFEWRSLGAQPAFSTKNRTEEIRVDLRVHVYREAPDHTDAAAAALARAEVLFSEIEQALETDVSVASTVTHGKVSVWSLTPVKAEEGWAIDGRITVEAVNHPG